MKVFLSDFDGTLVNKDILDILCGITGHEDESRALNEAFIKGERQGLGVLKERIDFLNGVTLNQIFSKLDENDYLIKGARELFLELKRRNIITVLHSGNLLPVLQYYQKKLGIDYIIGNSPRIKNDIIQGIEIEDFASSDFKVLGCKKIIDHLNINKENIIALGDSPADLEVFKLASKKIVINPKGNIEQSADIVLNDNLLDLVLILDTIL